jgi:acylphosphatase
MTVEIHAIVRGRVQGIGFRATARYYAQRLGIQGTVKNLHDGSVEIFAQGNQEQIDRFFADMAEEVGHNIKSITKDDVTPFHHFEGFQIIY